MTTPPPPPPPVADDHRHAPSKLPAGFSLVPKAVGVREFRYSTKAAVAPLAAVALSLGFAAWAVRRNPAQPSGMNPATFSTNIGWTDAAVFVAYLAAVVFLATFNLRRMRAFARSVQRKDRCVCPNCVYDLRNIDEKLPCPECGDTTPREIAREQWRNWFTMIGFTEHHSHSSRSR